MRPAPSVARFQNLDVNTCRSLPETAGVRLSRRGGTPAATPKVASTFASNSSIARRVERPGKFPLYSQLFLIVPACRADCRLLPIPCQAEGLDGISQNRGPNIEVLSLALAGQALEFAVRGAPGDAVGGGGDRGPGPVGTEGPAAAPLGQVDGQDLVQSGRQPLVLHRAEDLHPPVEGAR